MCSWSDLMVCVPCDALITAQNINDSRGLNPATGKKMEKVAGQSGWAEGSGVDIYLACPLEEQAEMSGWWLTEFRGKVKPR